MNVAITGGIGSGKSSVAAAFAGMMPAELFSADEVCHQLMAPGASGWQEIVAEWGEKYLDADRSINRPALREDIFRNPVLRHRLENILHPLIRFELKKCMKESDKRGAVSIVEVPLLYEVRWQGDFAAVIVVYASESVCLKRICERDRLSAGEAGRIIRAQMPLEEKVGLSPYVVDNSGLWVQTYQQVNRLVRIIAENSGRQGKAGKSADKA